MIFVTMFGASKYVKISTSYTAKVKCTKFLSKQGIWEVIFHNLTLNVYDLKLGGELMKVVTFHSIKYCVFMFKNFHCFHDRLQGCKFF